MTSTFTLSFKVIVKMLRNIHCRQILYCLSHQGRPYIVLFYSSKLRKNHTIEKVPSEKFSSLFPQRTAMLNVQKINKHASLFELRNILMKKDVGKNLLEEKIKISSCWNTEKKNYSKWLVPLILWYFVQYSNTAGSIWHINILDFK